MKGKHKFLFDNHCSVCLGSAFAFQMAGLVALSLSVWATRDANSSVNTLIDFLVALGGLIPLVFLAFLTPYLALHGLQRLTSHG